MGNSMYAAVTPVNPTTKANSVRNAMTHVKVCVGYTKGKGIVTSAYPVERKDGFESIMITSGVYLTCAGAARLNRKQVADWEVMAEASLSAKDGFAWGLVLTVCERNGLKPSED